jgi:superfamily II DNA/RNA helicase
VLRRIIRDQGERLTNGIIFCNRKIDVDILAKSLKRHGFDAQAMHGDLDQKLRMKILQAFRDGELKLLIASDVAARGLDIPNVSHIFNFDVPIHSEDYVHRIGRTGRAGRSGKSITLCLPSEEKYLAKIEELVKKAVPIMASPIAAGEILPEPEPSRRSGTSERGARSGRGRRGEARSEHPRAAAAPESRPEARPEPTPASRPEPVPETRPEPQAEVRRDEHRHEQRAERHAEAPEPRRGRGERGGERRGDRGGRPVPGMGDHVPAFLMRDFRGGMVDDPAEEPEAEAVEAQAVIPEPTPVAQDPETATAEPVAEAAAPARKPARRRRVSAPAAA